MITVNNQQNKHKANLRSALLLLVVVLVFFFAIMLKFWLTK